MDQARVAAINAAGGDRAYEWTVPPTMLKVAAIDMLSVGAISATREDEREVAIEDAGNRQYRKLVLQNDRAVGGILVGHKGLFDQVTSAVTQRQDVSSHIAQLLSGDWRALGR
jgi:NAD(P)H-nitrite reductase large subunit